MPSSRPFTYVLTVQFTSPEGNAYHFSTVYGTLLVEQGESRTEILLELMRDVREKSLAEVPWTAESSAIIQFFSLEPETITLQEG